MEYYLIGALLTALLFVVFCIIFRYDDDLLYDAFVYEPEMIAPGMEFGIPRIDDARNSVMARLFIGVIFWPGGIFLLLAWFIKIQIKLNHEKRKRKLNQKPTEFQILTTLKGARFKVTTKQNKKYIDHSIHETPSQAVNTIDKLR